MTKTVFTLAWGGFSLNSLQEYITEMQRETPLFRSYRSDDALFFNLFESEEKHDVMEAKGNAGVTT